MAKFEKAVRARLPAANADRLMELAARPEQLEALPVTRFLSLFHPGAG
jgi:2-methylcitrate dehydratase